MITLLVGHRGVGKTSLLRHLGEIDSFKKSLFIDLDAEIEEKEKKSVSDIFLIEGESRFRALEQEVLGQLLKENSSSPANKFIALGAGFDLKGFFSSKPNIKNQDLKILWVQRLSDVSGRIFLDRPRLNSQLSPLEEYDSVFARREETFAKLSDARLVLREGEFASIITVEDALKPVTRVGEGATRTLWKNDLADLKWSLKNLVAKGFDYLELRTDLLAESMIDEVFERVESLQPAQKLLVALRAGYSSVHLNKLELTSKGKPLAVEVDWDLALGPAPSIATSVSSHSSKPPMQDRGKGDFGVHQKWSPLVDDLYMLMDGHQWWREDSANRSFLPRSETGRWAWYRQIQKGKMKFNFVREDRSHYPDQPTLMEWAATPHQPKAFAAVLGDPVMKSWSPVFHEKFFYPNGIPFVRLQLTADEMTAQNLDFLSDLGLEFAAVTSPLKAIALPIAAEKDSMSVKLGSLNTLKRVSGRWRGKNTDIMGLQLFKKRAKGEVAIWGAGSLAESLKFTFPEAKIISMRDPQPLAAKGPETLIWSASRAHKIVWPPDSWSPKLVLDLNYAEDSPGKEYALKKKCEYLNGTGMFMVQAQNQQLFWSE